MVLSLGWGSTVRRHVTFATLSTFLLISCTLSRAAESSSFTILDIGAYTSNLQSTTSSAGFLRLRHGFPVGKKLFFEPSFGAVLPWQSGVDGFEKIFTFHLNLDVAVPLFSFLRWRVGPGLMFLFYVQSGESVQLNNATTTSTYYVPGGVTIGFLGTIQTGLDIAFSRRISLSLDIFTLDIASDARRRFNGALTLGFFL
jgi:hypothetical protein